MSKNTKIKTYGIAIFDALHGCKALCPTLRKERRLLVWSAVKDIWAQKG